MTASMHSTSCGTSDHTGWRGPSATCSCCARRGSAGTRARGGEGARRAAAAAVEAAAAVAGGSVRCKRTACGCRAGSRAVHAQAPRLTGAAGERGGRTEGLATKPTAGSSQRALGARVGRSAGGTLPAANGSPSRPRRCAFGVFNSYFSGQDRYFGPQGGVPGPGCLARGAPMRSARITGALIRRAIGYRHIHSFVDPDPAPGSHPRRHAPDQRCTAAPCSRCGPGPGTSC